jgi:hypothetical protein
MIMIAKIKKILALNESKVKLIDDFWKKFAFIWQKI